MKVYFDNSATTPVREEALKRYIEVSGEHFGNPSSLHALGDDAAAVLAEARRDIAKCVGGVGGSIIFTSSGTEANNLAIFGRAYAKERYKGARIITGEGEHSSVSEPLAMLKRQGYDVVCIPTKNGVFDIKALEEALTPKTVLVTVMAVNNETGALYDISAISRAVHLRAPEALFHVDATQAFMKTPINVKSQKIDMLTVSSHKIEGPKGVGALWIDQSIVKTRGLCAVTLGGGQEGGLRSGTENVPGIAGFAAAAVAAYGEISKSAAKMNTLREYIINRLANTEVRVLMPNAHAPHIINIILPKIKSQTMLNHLSANGICVSSGSACSSNTHHASGALASFGISDEESDYSIRVSLSRNNTKDEADYFIEKLSEGLSSLQRVK